MRKLECNKIILVLLTHEKHEPKIASCVAESLSKKYYFLVIYDRNIKFLRAFLLVLDEIFGSLRK